MPIYDYICNKCGHQFEINKTVEDNEIKSCPSCKSKKTKKLFTFAGISFKGSGFHVNDYKK